jgi:CheY-like chemotaxis protein
VEDDPHYARIVVDLARDKGFKVLVSVRGADALELAKQYQPTAISLDVFLPDMLGWTVLSQLKQNPLTRHIPVQIVTLDEDRQHGLAHGAFSFVTKPSSTEGLSEAIARVKAYVQPRKKRLLLVEDNPAEQLSITSLLGHDSRSTRLRRRRSARRDAHDADRLRGPRPQIARHFRLRCP